MSTCRVVYVLATPAPENLGLISREQIERMLPGALLVVISRAHLVDFPAVVEAAEKGKIQAARKAQSWDSLRRGLWELDID